MSLLCEAVGVHSIRRLTAGGARAPSVAGVLCSFAPFLVLLLLGAAGWERQREGPKKDKRAITL